MAQTLTTPTALSLDQFYTRKDTATRCITRLADRLPEFSADLYVEPAAGDGAFLHNLPDPCFGIDVAPACTGIVAGDFLAWQPEATVGTVAVVGNPPFGKNASKAIAFFNHAARFAEVIAMIMPASLGKASMQDRLDRRYHLVNEMPLHAEPFRIGSALHEVNAVFQIWRREDFDRPKSVRRTTHADFRFVTSITDADFVVRRVGARAGAILALPNGTGPMTGYAPSTNLFVQASSVDPRELEARFRRLDLGDVCKQATANPSVSKSDLVALYDAQLEVDRVLGAVARGARGAATPSSRPTCFPAMAAE